MPLCRFRAGFCLALLCGGAVARADDAVGILRVDVASNETVAEGNPLSGGKGNVPKADRGAFERAVQDLMKFIPKMPPLMIVPSWIFMEQGQS